MKLLIDLNSNILKLETYKFRITLKYGQDISGHICQAILILLQK